MSTKYQSSYEGALPFSDVSPTVALAASTPLTYTVPGDKFDSYVIEFQYADSANIYIANNSTAVVPSAGTVDATSRSAYRPYRRFVRGGDVLSMITPDTTATFGLSLYQLPA